ncbi:hypothetical protein [Chryseobacterium ginsenosidimutans]|uniref:hypothetical protein n=1 Tax=Chryseobacterium ginsenosidimutans TaxID=687846 RepID=UPI0027BA1D47|nr:hypothetical protein [Chryseobacterium ginsenosidimutans]
MDSDGDGIIDESDACPKIAGIADNHGCPGIRKEVLDANKKRQEDQFRAFTNKFDFNQLSNLIIKNIEGDYFKSDNLISKDIVIVSLNITNFGNDISTAKPQLPKDDEILRSKLENSLWNEKNFDFFLKKTSGKKVLTAHSYGNGNNVRIINFDSNDFPINKFVGGEVIVPRELMNNVNEKLFYYIDKNKKNEEISIDKDLVDRYAGLTIYILQIKNKSIKVCYYYNFRTGKFKNFQFINNKWKEISDAEYDKFDVQKL